MVNYPTNQMDLNEMSNNLISTLKTLENLPDPDTKAELLERMDAAYDAAESLLYDYDEADLTRPLAASGWSVKDYLAHLATWERGMVALLKKKDRFQAMGIDQTKIDISDHDAVNDFLYGLNKERPLSNILTSFRQTHQDLLTILTPLTDADLQKSYRHYQPHAEEDYFNKPVMGWLAGNTYHHYVEHLGEIGRLLKEARDRRYA